MHAVTITHLSRSPGLNFLPQNLLQSIYSHFMSTHLRTQPCASCHLDLHKKHSRRKNKHAKYSNTSFPPSSQGLWLVTCSTLTHSTGTNGCRSKAHSTRRGSELFRRWRGGGQQREATMRSGTACGQLPLLHRHHQNQTRCCHWRWTPPHPPDVAADRSLGFTTCATITTR